MATSASTTASNETAPWDPRGALARGMLTVFSGQGVAYVITFASLPVLAALYAPEQFTALGIFSAIVAVVGGIASLCFDKVVPLQSGDRAAANGLAVCLASGVVVSLVLGVAAFAFFDLVTEPLQLYWLEPYLPLACLTVFAIACQQAFLAWCVRRQDYKSLSITRIVICITRVAVQIGLAFLWRGPVGLLIGFSIGNLVGAVLAALLCRNDWRLARYVRLKWMGKVIRRYRRFPLYAAVPEITQRLSFHLPGVLLAITYNYQVAAWYILAQRLFGVPQTLFQQAASRVFFGIGAREAVHGPDRIRLLFSSVFKWLVVIAAAPFLLAMLFAPWLIGFAFDEKWAPAGSYCSLLAPMFFAQLIYESLRPVIDLLKRPQLHTVGSLIVTASLAVGIALPCYLGWSPLTAVVCLSICVSAGQSAALYIAWRAIPTVVKEKEKPLFAAAA